MAIILYPALPNIFLFVGLGYFSISFILLFYKCVVAHDRQTVTEYRYLNHIGTCAVHATCIPVLPSRGIEADIMPF